MLGLGSQIKPHITKRFSMPWSHPAPRMRELILAIRAIWDTWETGEHARLPGRVLHAHADDAVLQPGPEPLRQPQDPPGRRGRAHDRGGGRGRRRVPGPRLHHRALPARGQPARARARRGQGGQDPRPTSRSRTPASSSPATDEREHGQAAAKAVREQIAFYGSTPAYRPVLELHGWGDLQPELNTLSKRGEWVEMGELIDDDMLDAFAVVCPLDQVADRGAQPLRGHGRPLQLLRPVQGRPRAVEGACWPASTTEPGRPAGRPRSDAGAVRRRC